MAYIIAMIGPNAIGKTTAVRRWCERYSQLVGCCCDSSLTIMDSKEHQEPRWQKQGDDRAAAIEHYKSLDRIVVVEGASGFGVRICREIQPDYTIVLTCSGEAAKEYMRQRCERRGKKFRDDYWTEPKTSYEGERRCVNFAAKELPDGSYNTFRIENQLDDWVPVDEHFHLLYRRIQRQQRERGGL